MIRIGMLGAGVVADIHAGSFGHLPNAKITKVFDVHTEASERLAARRGAAAVKSADAILDTDDIDAVLV
jgi:myo-inositol 2-dehydrogenase/D-chiro-inositol 1-dehydrogenase